MERYLDLDLLVNGCMDALLLILTARLLNLSLQRKGLVLGVMVGEIPVLLSAFFPESLGFELSKYFTPLLMVRLAYPYRSIRKYGKTLLLFWILSAGLGGVVYALWGWLNSSKALLRVELKNLWILPIGAFLWWLTQKAWHRMLSSAAHLKKTIYELAIDFGGEEIAVKALLDTGNQLRDPLTGNPVILLEEEIAATALPQEFLPALEGAWQEEGDPWSWLFQRDPQWLKSFVFISYQGVEHQGWLLGFRPQKVVCTSLPEPLELKATIALVKYPLSPEGIYQALLHPEHLQ
ncbi:MAG: sigma-E processing peptidase SpoIIGA [Desulfitobacterium sp.]|nr:sigma-E processing peptidase SpoIIGA [Desulfitobacterium sp.]